MFSSILPRIVTTAGCFLPLSQANSISKELGTRHRAAIGMTETSDAACLVVSEETGDVSIALDGTLKKYEDLVSLKQDLEKILGYKNTEETDEKSNFKTRSCTFNYNFYLTK